MKSQAEEWNNKKETTEDKYDDPMAKDDVNKGYKKFYKNK